MFLFKSKKWFFIAIGIIIVVFITSYSVYKKNHPKITYETVSVTRSDLNQTVEVSGKIQSENDLSLKFEVPGTIESIKVKENDVINPGTILATLKLSELNAAVSQAQANLDQKLAGATDSEKNYYKAVLTQTQADLEKTRNDAENSIVTAQSNVDTALNNLKLAEGGENSQIVNNAYDDAIASLRSAISILDNALNQADNILGVDNTSVNDDFEIYLGALDSSKLNTAKIAYSYAKTSKNQAKTSVSLINSTSNHSSIDNALNLTEDAFIKMNTLLSDVYDLLLATTSGGSISQTSLDTKKSTIDATRTAVNTKYATIITNKQSLSNSKNSYSTYLIAYNKALKDLETTKSDAQSLIQIKESSVAQAQANLDNKINPPRNVDIASYRAALDGAIANREKAIIKSPVSGVVAKINKKRGESVSGVDSVIDITSPHFEINVDIPETDVIKIKNGDIATITLDAFGDDIKFTGKIAVIEPASTDIQDVVYYKVKITLDETDKEIKSGMTANVTIGTAKKEKVLNIPIRAIRLEDGKRYVKILKDDNTVIESEVKIGLKADDGKVEILEGLNEGENVILSTNDPSKK